MNPFTCSTPMNRAQRIVLIVYCLLIIYCCAWVPWHLAQTIASESQDELRCGYGWLWIGPSEPAYYNESATPNLTVIGLRLLAASAMSGAGFLLAGMFKSSARSFHA
jgi:hypothetical protein